MIMFSFYQTYTSESDEDIESQLIGDISEEFGRIDLHPTYDYEREGELVHVDGTIMIPPLEFLSSTDGLEPIKEWFHPAVYNESIDMKNQTLSVTFDMDFQVDHPDTTNEEVRRQGLIVARDAFETDSVEPKGVPKKYGQKFWNLTFVATIGETNSIVRVATESVAKDYTPSVDWKYFEAEG